MAVNNVISKLRANADMSQEQFAELFGVSRQSVQKWESGASLPDLDKLIKISKHFDISLDALIFDSDARIIEELKATKELKPKYDNIHVWESYYSTLGLQTEYLQSVEEGLDIAQYKDLFDTVTRLPHGEIKKKLGDVLFHIVCNAKTVEGYKYNEPSTLDEIKALRKRTTVTNKVDKSTLKDKIHGAWMGRICGCLLGKTIEGIKTDELIPVLKNSNNYPMHRYIVRKDIDTKMVENYRFRFENRPFADEMDGMPVDDDTNYVVLAQKLIEKYGKDFTDYDMSRIWLSLQPKDAYCTAERVAFCNFVNGYEPPESAVYKNPYREWIGAQIRGDYFGYIAPGNPEFAAEMAFRDASISHVKNGIYGEMFIAAMIATAAVTNDIKEIIYGGLAQIPYTSRLYEAIIDVINGFENGVSQEDCFRDIHNRYNEYTTHGWCHTISNAMIVVASLLYGKGDYRKSICMAVETGFDTDCNGATVGSILGMAFGITCIDEVWTKPINNKLHTSIFGVGTINITDAVELTMKHIKL